MRCPELLECSSWALDRRSQVQGPGILPSEHTTTASGSIPAGKERPRRWTSARDLEVASQCWAAPRVTPREPAIEPSASPARIKLTFPSYVSASCGICPCRYPQPEHHRYGRSPFSLCRSGCPGRARTDPGMARPYPRPAAPARRKGGVRQRPPSCFREVARDPRPAGPAARLGAGPRRIDPRCLANRHRLDVPPPRLRAGTPGPAGTVPRHRGLPRQNARRYAATSRHALVAHKRLIKINRDIRETRRDSRDDRIGGLRGNPAGCPAPATPTLRPLPCGPRHSPPPTPAA